jgi:cobalamin synthase
MEFMSIQRNRLWNFFNEGFARLVFWRGLVQFGVLSTGFFLLLSALRGDSEFELHANRALIAFPFLGLAFGTMLWIIGRIYHKLFGRKQE